MRSVGSSIVVLERVKFKMLTEERNNVLLEDIVPVVLYIHSDSTDIVSCPVMIADTRIIEVALTLHL